MNNQQPPKDFAGCLYDVLNLSVVSQPPVDVTVKTNFEFPVVSFFVECSCQEN